jgi:hypothetical protein
MRQHRGKLLIVQRQDPFDRFASRLVEWPIAGGGRVLDDQPDRRTKRKLQWHGRYLFVRQNGDLHDVPTNVYVIKDGQSVLDKVIATVETIAGNTSSTHLS